MVALDHGLFGTARGGKRFMEGGTAKGLRAPSRLLWLAEARWVYELGAALVTAPVLLKAPRGDGHPVLVLPGFLASDASTEALRLFLKRQGYDTYAWELGRNLGGIGRMRDALVRRLEEIYRKTGKRVSVVGWSLGGVYARLLASECPTLVRSVVTLGSPFSRDPNASNVNDLYERLTGEGPSKLELAQTKLIEHEFDRLADDLAVPSTSIYSKLDGIVNWRSSILHENATTENIEVIGASHIGLGVNAAVLWATADRLSQPQGAFAPFERGGPFAVFYGRHDRTRERTAA